LNYLNFCCTASKGKLSRQIANLKQTLSHTADNSMQLDNTVDMRRHEIENISNDIMAERDHKENNQKDLKRI
jgi:septal ring factor EnvC (AmiA/AmiB activator)